MADIVSITVTPTSVPIAAVTIAIPGPPGPPGTSLNASNGETPSGTIDGVNAAYTLAHIPDGKIFILALNGLIQHAGASNDFTSSGATITFNHPPTAGDVILATYTF